MVTYRKSTMKRSNKVLLTLCSFLLLSSCGSASKLSGGADINYIKVYKYDKSLQCEPGGISVTEMQKSLEEAGIKVKCAKKSEDGLMRIQSCGSPTGKINVYEIPEAKLSIAESLKFKSVTTLTEYTDSNCSTAN